MPWYCGVPSLALCAVCTPRCWPVLLAGRDVEAISEPGSGKTLAYMLPAAVVRMSSLSCKQLLPGRLGA